MEYQVSDVTWVNDIKRLRLHQWIKEGYVRPSIQAQGGKGTPNKFSKDDLYAIAVFKKLIETGRLSRDFAAQFIKDAWQWMQGFEKGNSGRFFYIAVSVKDDIIQGPIPFFDNKQFLDMFLGELANMDEVHLINVKKIKEQVDKKIQKLRR